MLTITDAVIRELLEFRSLRDWEQFHTPKNLAASLVIESAELLECFQWARDSELSDLVVRDRERIEDEIADIAILLNYLCVDLQVDVNVAIKRKVRKNNEKYPVHLARGSATKYDQL